MGSESTVLLKEDVEQLTALCAQLHRDSNSKTIVLIDKRGKYIASSGQVAELDLTSLASLTAGNMAATSGLAELIGEADFQTYSTKDNVKACTYHWSVTARS